MGWEVLGEQARSTRSPQGEEARGTLVPSMEEYVSDKAFNERILDAADDLLTDVGRVPDDDLDDYRMVQVSRLDALRSAIEAKFEATGR